MLPQDSHTSHSAGLADSSRPSIAPFAAAPHFPSSSSSSQVPGPLAPVPAPAPASASASSSTRDPFAYPPAPRRSSLGARKGKGRAVEPPPAAESNRYPEEDGSDDDDDEPHHHHRQRAAPTGLSFCVRFTDGQTQDVIDLWVGERESVREVKRRLRLLRPRTLLEEDKPRRLRLIQLGRLLPDGVFLVPYTAQLLAKRAAQMDPAGKKTAHPPLLLREGLQAVGRGLGKVASAVARSAAEGGGGGRARDELDTLERGGPDSLRPLLSGEIEEEEESGGDGREDAEPEEEEEEEQQIWLHCSVGDVEVDEADEGEANSTAAAEANQITPLQGFDRLRDAGFSQEEIDRLRTEFRESRGGGGGAGGDAAAAAGAGAGEGDDAEHQRALEEQWLSGMTGQEEALASAGDSGAGNYYALLKGISMGFFVPFLPLFFFRTQLFTKRMQMAIVLGIIINLGFGFLRWIG